MGSPTFGPCVDLVRAVVKKLHGLYTVIWCNHNKIYALDIVPGINVLPSQRYSTSQLFGPLKVRWFRHDVIVIVHRLTFLPENLHIRLIRLEIILRQTVSLHPHLSKKASGPVRTWTAAQPQKTSISGNEKPPDHRDLLWENSQLKTISFSIEVMMAFSLSISITNCSTWSKWLRLCYKKLRLFVLECFLGISVVWPCWTLEKGKQGWYSIHVNSVEPVFAPKQHFGSKLETKRKLHFDPFHGICWSAKIMMATTQS